MERNRPGYFYEQKASRKMKKKRVPKKKFVKTKTESRKLPCRLTDKEILGKADELSKSLISLDAEDAERKSVQDYYKANISKLKATVLLLQGQVSERREVRDVDVCLKFRNDGVVVEVRQDTGEVVVERKMTAAETQGEFEFNEGGE